MKLRHTIWRAYQHGSLRTIQVRRRSNGAGFVLVAGFRDGQRAKRFAVEMARKNGYGNKVRRAGRLTLISVGVSMTGCLAMGGERTFMVGGLMGLLSVVRCLGTAAR